MAARSALGRAPHKTAGGLLFVAGTTIVMGIITAEALYTAAYDARMEISDLGASETGVILQPSSTIFNATMLAAGAMILAAAWFAHQALHRRPLTIPTGLLGIGVLGVGVFPGNIHPQHPLFAFTAFVAGGLAVLLSAKVTPQPLRAIFAVMGTVSLSFTLSSVFLLEWGPFARLDLGGVERWMVYPILLWLVGFGGYLTASHTAEVPGASRPDTARSLDGHREGVPAPVALGEVGVAQNAAPRRLACATASFFGKPQESAWLIERPPMGLLRRGRTSGIVQTDDSAGPGGRACLRSHPTISLRLRRRFRP